MAQETAPDAPPEKASANDASPQKPRRAPRWLLACVPVVALSIFVLPPWLDERAAGPNRTLSDLTLGGVSMAHLGRDELSAKVTAHAKTLASRRVVVRVAGKRFETEPEKLGVHVDVARTVQNALAVGRAGGVLARAADHFRRSGTPREIAVVGALDAELLRAAVETWEAQSLADRPFAGGIEVAGSTVKEVAPRGGRRVDAARASALLLSAALAPSPRDVDLPLVTVPAPLPADAAREAAADARVLLQGPVTLTSTAPAESVTLLAAELGPALTTEREQQQLRLAFRPDQLAKLFEAPRARIEAEPVDAKFEVSPTGAVSIVPSRAGLRIELERIPAALLEAATTPTRSAELPLAHRPEPALSTAQAEALGVKGLVSSFTTRHPCCEKRVANIHRIADLLDGQVVLPGQTVSVNALVGPRTLKRGFVPAPTIEEGEMVDSIGGGISQFATTFFNALFHGGYDIIERQPHTYWFPRYPMGHEATLSWPKPDIIFHNDTQAGLLIKTAYTDTTITVKLYGDNGGRKVRAEVSGRQNIVKAPLEIWPNASVPPDEEKVKEPGSIGWSVIVSRIVTFPDGTKKEERRRVTYKARPRRIELHPCRIPEGEKGYTGERCPVPEAEEAVPSESGAGPPP
jgi:vancomycin resistance protein YoaR